VSVLSVAPSLLFRLYYFQIYFAIIVCGAFNGLFVMPVVLSLVGWQADASDDGGARQEDAGAAPPAPHSASYAAAAAALKTKELEPRCAAAGAGLAAFPARPTVASGVALVAPELAAPPSPSPSHASAYGKDEAPAKRGVFLR
jgi:hypothetical protein